MSTGSFAPFFGSQQSLNQPSTFQQPTSTATGFGGFGAPLASAPQQTTPAFTGFGGFGTQQPATSQQTTPASSAFGGFGTQQPATSQQTTPATTTFGFFGAQSIAAPQQSMSTSTTFGGFGAQKPTIQQPATTSFGSAGFGSFASTASTAPNQPAQQKQQDAFLDLKAAFPDSKVPHYIVRPNGTQHIAIPPSSFLGGHVPKGYERYHGHVRYKPRGYFTPVDENKRSGANIAFRPFGEETKVLPGFLTGTGQSPTKKANRKRILEELNRAIDNASNKRPKIPETGIFANKEGSFGYRHYSEEECNTPPVLSMWDVGVNPCNIVTPTKESTIASSHKSDSESTLLQPVKNEGESSTLNVFGFIMKDLPFILEYLAQHGEIAEYQRSEGTWIVVTYKTVESAQKALKDHGKVLSDGNMIGFALVPPNQKTASKKPIENGPSESADNKKKRPLPPGVHKKRRPGFLHNLKEIFFGW
ncbi:hypothetical protein DFQ28_009797 [Apophysomyces sp. BC1034]|nr:hypothetical protein DFQ30_009507 [Apophysomyces sp. BC1015]KAG0181620.1 hypothetical protein DFQ29_007724 [Apophysomyces sp. BC1021]KAG0192223.1 hypothetical protein DFQ28_009797 [Apophysomyces sp. BC1034]